MNTPLFEQYRPRTWTEVVGQDKAINRIHQVGKRSYAGRCWWISGQSGTGKTTIARLIAGEVADDFNVQEVDATALTPAALRELEASMYCIGMGGRGRAFIVNEAHGLNRAAIRQLLVLTERLPSHVVIIFTTTVDGQEAFEDYDDAMPLLSRCITINLARRDITKPMAERLKMGAEREGLDGQPIEKYIRLLQTRGNNMRAAWQDIESGVMIAGAEA